MSRATAPILDRVEQIRQPAYAEPTAIGPWASFLGAFQELLELRRSGADRAAADQRLHEVRHELAELRARLANGGVAVPEVRRRPAGVPAVVRPLGGYDGR